MKTNLQLFSKMFAAIRLQTLMLILGGYAGGVMAQVVSTTTPFDYGTGIISTNSAPFSTAGGTNITVSGNDVTVTGNVTMTSGIYNFANLTINAGAVVTVSGTAPLIIKCTGTLQLDGTITLRGGNGTNANAGSSPGFAGAAGGGGGGAGGGGGSGSSSNGHNGNYGVGFANFEIRRTAFAGTGASISGTSLSFGGQLLGTVVTNVEIRDQAAAITAGTIITAGSASPYTVNNSQTVSATTIISPGRGNWGSGSKTGTTGTGVGSSHWSGNSSGTSTAPNRTRFGGGGGSYGTVGLAATNYVQTFYNIQSFTYGDPNLVTVIKGTNVLGGSGGGGGGGQANATTTLRSGGGGGGGGGGGIAIISKTITFGASGLLTTKGGNGGTSARGGAGGGGSGGTVLLEYQTINSYSTNSTATVTATAGVDYSGGIAGTTISAGGNGGEGRFLVLQEIALISWNGSVSTDWNNGSNWTPAGVPPVGSDILIPNSADLNPTISSFAAEVADIEVEDERTLTINGNASLSVSGVLLNEGIVNVNSGGALVQTTSSTNAGSGTYNVQRQIPAGPNNAFRFMGSPISNISATSITGVSASGSNGGQVTPMSDCNANFVASGSPYGNILELRENPAAVLFNCAQSLWFVKSAGSLVNGRGYAMKANGGQTITFSGSEINNGSKTVTGLTRQSGTVNDHVSGGIGRGWHMLSNPYPSPIRISSAKLTSSGLNGTNLHRWNSATQSWVSISPGDFPVTIAVGQAFQVRQGTEGGNTSFEFTNDMRFPDVGVQFFDQTYWNDYLLNVKISGNSFTDETTVFFNPDATPAFDSKWDSNKLLNSPERPAIFTLVGTERMAYNGLPLLNQPTIVPMALYPGTSGTYTLDFSELETLPATAMVYLEDKKTGVWTNVRAQNAYTFTSVTSDNIQRFNIHFEPPVNISSLNESCLLNDGSISINNPSNETWSVSVESNGNEVYQSNVAQGEVSISNLVSGVYTLSLTNNTYTVSEEITIEAGTPAEANFNLSNETFQVFDIITATVQNPLANASYTWYLNELFAGIGTSTSFAISDKGTYTIGLDAVLGTCKSSSSGSFEVEGTTSISNLDKDDLIRVYPNPANEMVTIVWEGRANNFDLVRVMDISGRTVQSIQIGGRTQGNQLILDLSDVTEGLYLISLEGQDVKKTVKVTVVH